MGSAPQWQFCTSPRLAMVKITRDLIGRSARLKCRRDETPEAHLARISHVALNNKGITSMEGLAHVSLKSCSVMYLYDNSISTMEGLHQLSSLKDLYLQNNNIDEINGLRYNTGLQ